MSLLSNVSATVIQGQQVVGKQVSAENLGVSGILNVTGDVVLSSANLLNNSGVTLVGSTSATAVVAYTIVDGVSSIIANNGAAAFAVQLTFPDPAANKGRTLIIKNLSTNAAGTVKSANANVVLIGSLTPVSAAGDILVAAAAGPPIVPTKGIFVCDGTNWVQMF